MNQGSVESYMLISSPRYSKATSESLCNRFSEEVLFNILAECGDS